MFSKNNHVLPELPPSTRTTTFSKNYHVHHEPSHSQDLYVLQELYVLLDLLVLQELFVLQELLILQKLLVLQEFYVLQDSKISQELLLTQLDISKWHRQSQQNLGFRLGGSDISET